MNCSLWPGLTVVAWICQMTSLNSLVENVLHDLETETTDRKIDWRVGSLPCVNCDPGLIQQAFANLLSNAVKYTRRRERAVIEIDQSTINGQLVLFVRDNGAGFNPKYSDKLFGTFQRLHTDQEFEGTGVGQVTVRTALMKEKTLQVLLVEDNAGDVRLLREMFRGERAGQFRIDAPPAHEGSRGT